MMMTIRSLVTDGSALEAACGYSRAVRVGNLIAVSGTTAMGADGPVGVDAAEQTQECLRRIGSALERAGASLDDVMRTRIYLTNIEDWRSVGDVHREFFGPIGPALTIVEVSRLFDLRLLVEVEADAAMSGGPL